MGRVIGEAGEHGRMNGFPKTGTRVWYRAWNGRELQLGDYPGQAPRRMYRPTRDPAAVDNPSAPWLFQDFNFVTS